MCGRIWTPPYCNALFGLVSRSRLLTYIRLLYAARYIVAASPDGFPQASPSLALRPRPVRIRPHLLHSFAADFSGEHRAETAPPKSNSFVTDVDAALVQQILNIPQRERKPSIHHNRQANDLRAAVKILDGVAFCHVSRLRNCLACLKSNPSDKTLLWPKRGAPCSISYLTKTARCLRANKEHLTDSEFHQ